MPPTPVELADFLNDDSADAYEEAVDRLLASPRYGERMAVEWLDAARYADTNGYQTDGERSMWRWRDWVIDAYNANMPFDRFTIEQLAGDMLPGATLEQRVATAFNRNHSLNSEGGIVVDEFLAEYGVDRVSTTGTVWMGLTLGCARCHDHKFDPISAEGVLRGHGELQQHPRAGQGLQVRQLAAPGHRPHRRAAGRARRAGRRARRGAGGAGRPRRRRRRRRRPSGRRRSSGRGRSTWNLRDGLLAYHAFEGTIDGIQTSTDVPAVLEDGLPQFSPGVLGYAASFDGRRFVNAGNHPDVGYDDSFSLAAWMYPTAENGVVVSRAAGGDQGEVGWGLYLEDGKLRMNLSTRVLDDGVAAETVEDIALGRWQHVVATYDGSKTPEGIRIYVDGRLQATEGLLDLVGNRLPATRYPLRIGASGSDKPRFRGNLDEVRVYEGLLTPAEVAVVATSETLGQIAALEPGQRTAAQADKLRLAFLDQYAPPAVQEAVREVARLERQRDELWASFPTVMVMEERTVRKPTYRLNRGSYDAPAEEVFPGVPARPAAAAGGGSRPTACRSRAGSSTPGIP